FGGGVCVGDNTTIISNSTISGNEARGAATTGSMTGRGGGIHVIGGAWGVPPTVDTLLVLEDSTICDNIAETVGAGISAYRYAGTMGVAVELRNTIVADNHEGGGAVLGNCVEASPAVITSSDFNLADDLTCNLVGTDDLVVADVMLGPLADHGGPTWNHQPLTGSPAVDSGDDALCPAVDQRGYVRPWDGDGNGSVHCDRGAVELGAPYFHDGFETGTMSGWSITVP
ncbi:MAG TPA: choice-of-anchor Q domain-containing protein, partial [Candidatus Sulfomarinibacteraceae bacterium]|nr:choice-of-anchor Q domain-containing protein [Candidatus Sulfomarinibacteraceae bacterium]